MVKYGSEFFILAIVTVMLSGFFAFASLVPGGGERGRWRHDPNPEKLYHLSNVEGDTDIADARLFSYRLMNGQDLKRCACVRVVRCLRHVCILFLCMSLVVAWSTWRDETPQCVLYRACSRMVM